MNWIGLGNPDHRRALRSIIQALVVIAMIVTIWFNIERLDAEGTKYILGWAMIIILVGTLGYIMENGLRTFNFKGWGAEASASTDAPAAAQAVAAAATEKAAEITEDVKP